MLTFAYSEKLTWYSRLTRNTYQVFQICHRQRCGQKIKL